MKQPTIVVNGVECKVAGVSWHKDGELAHIVFWLDGEVITAFDNQFNDEEGLQESGVYYLNNLAERLERGE